MAMRNDDVIQHLNGLIETCKDGEYGFATCARAARGRDLVALFNDRANQCRRSAESLQRLVVQYGGTPEHSGSAAGAMHRGWVTLKGAASTWTDRAILEECERGEDRAVARYRDALGVGLPEDVQRVVQAQYEGVRRNHDQVKALRDRAGETV
jgi:uncharacterized protein (TIGR02284 family)